MMNALTAADLKEKLKSRGLPTTGTKAELVKRLLEAGFQPEDSPTMAHAEEESEASTEPPAGTSTQVDVPTLGEIELLRKERDLAAREAELLRRELELLRMTPRSEDALVRAGVRKWQ